jgi:hypothetical protein
MGFGKGTRFGIVAAALTAVGWVAPAGAAPTGGLAAPPGAGALTTSIGVSYAERDLKSDGNNDGASAFKTLLRGEYGVLGGISLYAFAGFSDLKIKDADFEGTRGADLGAGLRYGLVSVPDSRMRLVLDLQTEYLQVRDGSRRVHAQAYHAATYLVGEYGPAGGIGYFYPYGGFRVSYAHYDGKNGVRDYRSQDLVGVFAGADTFVNPNVYFSAEVHLFDETSVSLSAGYRF